MSVAPPSVRLYEGDFDLTVEELNLAVEEIKAALEVCSEEWKMPQLRSLLTVAEHLIARKAN